jgi:hypothetical protein
VDDLLTNHDAYGFSQTEAIVYTVVRDIAQDQASAVSIVQTAEQDLSPIAADHRLPGHEAAKVLLQHYLGFEFDEPVILPFPLRRSIAVHYVLPASIDLLEVNPNPANDRLVVIAKVPVEELGAYLAITDMQGQEVQRMVIGTGAQLRELNTRAWAPGLYRLVLYGRRGVLDGRSVSIVH